MKYPKTVLAGLALVALGNLVAASTQAQPRIIKSTGKIPAARTAEQNGKRQKLDQERDAIKKAQKEASDRAQHARRQNENMLIIGVGSAATAPFGGSRVRY